MQKDSNSWEDLRVLVIYRLGFYMLRAQHNGIPASTSKMGFAMLNQNVVFT